MEYSWCNDYHVAGMSELLVGNNEEVSLQFSRLNYQPLFFSKKRKVERTFAI